MTTRKICHAHADRGVAGEADEMTDQDVIDDALQPADDVRQHRGPRDLPDRRAAAAPRRWTGRIPALQWSLARRYGISHFGVAQDAQHPRHLGGIGDREPAGVVPAGVERRGSRHEGLVPAGEEDCSRPWRGRDGRRPHRAQSDSPANVRGPPSGDRPARRSTRARRVPVARSRVPGDWSRTRRDAVSAWRRRPRWRAGPRRGAPARSCDTRAG